jgi:two-component system nitrate/nitrite response regulator NarL
VNGHAQRITVLVADDHPVFREARRGIRESVPSVSVIDQHLPSLSGLDILRAVQRDSVPSRLIVLSGNSSGALVYEALQLGAAGFLTKVATIGEICDAIVAVARGETVVAGEVQSGLVNEMRSRSDPERPVLSEREAEVLALIADGLSVPQIADRLIISASTVKTHIRNLFQRLGVSDRAAAVAEAMRRGLLE